jgi:GxxExxY protein
MNTNDLDFDEMILKNEAYSIVGCAMEVLNELGHGLREKSFERSLVVEFGLRGIAFEQQKQFPVFYKGVQVDVFVPDLIAMNQIVVDTKTIERITDEEVGQMLNYLKITGLKLGLIVNFKHSKLEWRRVIPYSHQPEKKLGPFGFKGGSFSE